MKAPEMLRGHSWPGLFVLASVAATLGLVVRYLLQSGSGGALSDATDPGGQDGMIGLLAKQGDLVEARDLYTFLGDPNGTITARVDAAAPGQAIIEAHVEDARYGRDSGRFDLPRAEIRRILSSSAAPSTAPAPTAAGQPRELSWPIPLRTGSRYLARIQLEGFKASLANAAKVASFLSDQGFAGVMATQTRPGDWPASDTGAADKGTWFASGTWSGPPQSIARDSDTAAIQRAWEV